MTDTPKPLRVLTDEEWEAMIKTPLRELWRRQSAAFAERLKSPEFRREWIEALAKGPFGLAYVDADKLLYPDDPVTVTEDEDEIGFGPYP